MKYFKLYFLFVFTLILIPKCFCADININNTVKYTTSSLSGTYGAEEIDLGGTSSPYTIGTRYNGCISLLTFYSSYSFNPNTTYKITLNMATSDWRNNGFLGPQVFRANNDGSIPSTSTNWASNSSITFVSKYKIYFYFTTGSTISPYTKFTIYSSNYVSTCMTGTNNWNLSSIVLTTPSGSSGGSSGGSTPTPTPTPSGATNNDIINNQNQNTTDIINGQNQNTTDIINNQNQNNDDLIDNQNQNTQDLIDNQNNLSDKERFENAMNNNSQIFTDYTNNYSCSNNLISMSDYHIISNTYWRYYSSGTDFIRLISNSSATSSNFPIGYSFPVVSGKTYIISFDVSNDNYNQYQIYLYKSGWSNGLYKYYDVYQNNIMFTADYTGTMYFQLYMLKGNKHTSNFYLRNLQIRICNNKQDLINNYLTDDSNPSMSDNSISSLFSNVGYSDPLNYLLQLPVLFINKIVSLSNTCSSINLGTLLGSPIIFPCLDLESILGTSVWNTIDVICTVGLLVVIFKNLYQTFSNLLTMGGEKEAREKFNMPTPMEFLSVILGGDN